jgi:hypothetical protein
MTMATSGPGYKLLDPGQYGMLGKNFKSLGGGMDSAAFVLSDPALMAKLGLTAEDIKFTPSRNEHDNFIGEEYVLSDKAKEALKGTTLSRTGYGGMKDGRSVVLRDAQGNILTAGSPYSYDPAGDLKDAAVKAAAVMAAAYGAGSMLGGGAGTGAAAGAGEAAGGLAADAAGHGAFLGEAAAGAEAAGAAGAASSGAAGALAGDSAIKASLFGNAGYGAGMSGAATSAFDTVLGLTGSTALAGGAASAAGAVTSAADWLSSAWGSITGASGGSGGSLLGGLFSGSGLLRDLLPLIGAGVQQHNLEKMANDQRKWVDKKESDARKRRMPTTDPGMLGKFRVIPGDGNGG